MRIAGLCMLVAALVVLATGCSKKQEIGPLPIAGETAKNGAKLAYEHHLKIDLQAGLIAPRMAAVREACESTRFGTCNVLLIEQSEYSGTLKLRIVPSGVTPMSNLASQNGKLAWRQTYAEDLGPTIADNDLKLKQLEAYSAQVEDLSQRKDLSTSDLIALGHERAQIQVQREELQRVGNQQQRRVDTNLLELDFLDEAGGHHLGVSLAEWSNQLYDGIRDAFSMLAYGIPFLLLAFPLALGWRWIWRRTTKKGRERS